MSEKASDINVRLDGDTVAILNRMTKAQLIERIRAVALESAAFELRCEVAIEDFNKAQRKVERVQLQLEKAQEYNTQAEVMLAAIMERWNFYDV